MQGRRGDERRGSKEVERGREGWREEWRVSEGEERGGEEGE